MSISYHDIQAFLYREARLLDDRQWDEWLACYRKDAVFWMPAWDDDDRLTEDPQREISLIYYPSREGLEDRVYRIKTERSGASTPEPRTTHQISNLEVLSQTGDTVELRFNWHTLSHRYKQTDGYFGSSFYTLDVSGGEPRIVSKKVVLNNDYIHQVIDVYHV
ncbi:benzoate 1,2-dioxygenase small subunit [Halomonas desiderata]|jgi:benzoate/toluate 1,2-dioxygenase beta subunit|uniref:Benzoate 1,2-dioxygenase small subunit n=2 Tax=Billgrantia TaxID=3137761 RepID=A0AAW4YX08_9GAMM|nr:MULTISPECIES: benzoate 1,2-dioxygenase small subunit [Halomonas]MCE8026212.1 benzoate 1,2-dioxygenase small subunit [Halomonas aerodenitrificans]MCE8038840.1 benzoate 1,2-dioxygenase small subunit [Halomonas sp. MCCC 1A11062]MCE8044717.1 benzoate 1,2-dioxygenase small subunit [Halomonas desiderata]MCE8049291.1 benzoate 1,2-dioxygenase small subunit [Halomonas desiderata]MCE8052812.1 benzoate 1,2-dioxygenase small subunit [Halomonas desiderata]